MARKGSVLNELFSRHVQDFYNIRVTLMLQFFTMCLYKILKEYKRVVKAKSPRSIYISLLTLSFLREI